MAYCGLYLVFLILLIHIVNKSIIKHYVQYRTVRQKGWFITNETKFFLDQVTCKSNFNCSTKTSHLKVEYFSDQNVKKIFT